MKVRLLLLAIAALTLLQSYQAFSQANPLEPEETKSAIYLGPVVGYNRSMHSVQLSSFVSDPLCPYFENGSNNGYYFGMSYEQLFGNTVGSKHSLIARVLYSSLPASFTKEGDNYPSLVRDAADTTKYTTVWSTTRHSVDVTYNIISVEVMYKFNAIGNLGITAGPAFDFPIKKTMVQKYELVTPDNARFANSMNADGSLKPGYENYGRTYVPANGDIPQSASFRFALKLGLQYEIITGKKYYIVPAIYYNLGLTNVTSAESWKVNALQVGVDVRFAL